MNDTSTLLNDCPTSTWWGDYKFKTEENILWQIGPLNIVVRRLYNEWQIGYQRNEEFDDGCTIGETELSPQDMKENFRFVFESTTDNVKVTPALADRSIITRPLTPFSLAAGESTRLYVSTVLWFRLTTDSGLLLKEVPIQRLSDTWFGPSTLSGELCYAASTQCRINLKDLPERVHRAITPVVIKNQADTNLVIERLNLPTPQLQLYASDCGKLWTPTVTLIRERDGDVANLKIDNGAPVEANNAVVLCDAREKNNESVFYRAFNTVFSAGQ